MNSLRQMPLHMLLLAGFVGPLAAEDRKPAEPAAPATASSSESVAYAGLNVGARPAGQEVPGLTAGVGVHVGFIDPAGPSFGKVEEGDVLTRLDDQVLFNAEQFRALVRTHQPGDKVKLTLVREGSPQVVELTLGKRKVARAEAPAARAGAAPAAPGRSRVTINGNAVDIDPNGAPVQVGPSHAITIGPDSLLPPEIRRQLEDLGFAPGQFPRASAGRAADAVAPPATGRSSSHAFSFSFGNGASSSSRSVASDGEGTVSLEEKDGKKHAVVKDRDGRTLFDGEVTSKEQLEKLPADIRRRLKLVEGKGFTIPGSAAPTAPEEPKKKFDPKQGA
jgi:hypothetical protein